MSVKDARLRIDTAVRQWPEITSGAHRFGGLEWRLGATEIGHIHGDRQLDIVFPSRVRAELVAAGRARPHHIYPQIGITFYIDAPADVERAIDLLRLSYEIIQERRGRLAKHTGAK